MFKLLWRFTKSLILLLLVFIMSIALFIQFAPVFGGDPDEQSLRKMNASINYDGENFNNLVPTMVQTPTDESFSLLDFFKTPIGKNPDQALPSKYFDKNQFINGDFVWFGHSTVLMKTDGITILTDPVFYSASPVSFAIKPFAMQAENTINELPDIDVVLISHDHYDHLDYQAIQEINFKVEKYIVPLGIKSHLQRWGVADHKIEELDWYQDSTFASVQFTLTPSRHFSGRGITNRYSTLWGSWVIKSSALNLFFSGDSGYFNEFKKIGDKFGPFDIAFLEDGAYNSAWNQIHMYPEQSVQASIDLKAKVFFPIHWGKFDLSVHKWTDPIIRAKKKAQLVNVNVATPLIGEVFTVNNYPSNEWWEKIQ